MICVHLCQGFPCEEACLRMIPLTGDRGTAPWILLALSDPAPSRSMILGTITLGQAQAKGRLGPLSSSHCYRLPRQPSPLPQPVRGSLWCSPFCWDPPRALLCPFVFLVAPLSSESSTLGSHPEAELMELGMLIKWDFPIRHREGT